MPEYRGFMAIMPDWCVWCKHRMRPIFRHKLLPMVRMFRGMAPVGVPTTMQLSRRRDTLAEERCASLALL
jgi:hypothetical protein